MAEATDLLTLAEARSALNQGTQTTYDTLIAALVTAVSERLDSADGIGPTVTRTITAETHDGGGVCVQLAHWPATAIVTVTEDGTAVTSTGWHLDGEKGLLYRQSGDYDTTWEQGRDNISVTYRAGRVASTANVGERYKQGARLLLKHLWRAEQWNVDGIGPNDFDVPQIAYPSFGIPNAVTGWFGGEWRGKRGGFV